MTDSLLESELFGHTKGSFTGAYRDRQGKLQAAHRGTIFLDEVGEMSLRMQAMLLRFLENGEIQSVGAQGQPARVDVRVIAATNRNLPELIAAGQFREDLMYRLRVIHLEVPPLRERPRGHQVARRTISRAAPAGAHLYGRGDATAGQAPLARQRARAAQRRGTGRVDERQRGRGRRSTASGRFAPRRRSCCRLGNAAARWPTSSTTRSSPQATPSGITSTRSSCPVTSRGTICANSCAAGSPRPAGIIVRC